MEIAIKMKDQYKVRVPWFQPLSVVREVLKVYPGLPPDTIRRFINTIRELTGTPQATLDWSVPEKWIAERLDGDMAELARRFWVESEHRVNPRYIHGPDFLIRCYDLAEPDGQNLYRLTDLGQQFIQSDPAAMRFLDVEEGMLTALSIVAAKTHGKFGDLYPEWSAWVRDHSKFQADASIKAALRGRLKDLIDRGLINRDRLAYSATAAGLDWLKEGPADDPLQSALRAVQSFNSTQRTALRERLAAMHPYRFEHLVGELLTAMGYEDVVVTKQSGDKGVDVVATVQFGITTIREVVQVKRHLGNIHRKVIDQLRGALPYHNAYQGTIITTGDFAKNCAEAAIFRGAAPIGLIDGDRLLDLLFEHRIGVQDRSATLYVVDDAYFKAPEGGEQESLE